VRAKALTLLKHLMVRVHKKARSIQKTAEEMLKGVCSHEQFVMACLR